MQATRKKIIHILPHSPTAGAYLHIDEAMLPENYIKVDHYPFWLGYFIGDFHDLLARETLNQTDAYEIECWRPYDIAREIYQKEINGITHRLFPSVHRKIGKYDFGELSIELISDLKKEISTGNIIVHLHSLHSPVINDIISSVDLSNTPCIISQRGGQSPEYMIKKKPNPWNIFKFFKENVIYKQIDHFLVMSKLEYDRLLDREDTEVTFFQDGIDFDLFNVIEQKEARKNIGLDLSARVFIFIGRFDREKGLQHILKAFKRLYKLNTNTVLFLIGGSKEDELFDKVHFEGVKVLNRIPREDLVNYYSASDVLLYTSTDYRTIDFAGLSNAAIESLACGTPIYTSQFKHFIGSDIEKNSIGMEYRISSSIEKDLLLMLKNKKKYNRCREISMKYYSRKNNVSRLIKIYNQISKKYA